MPEVAEQALWYKKLHEWGYRFNESGTVGDLTQTQQQLVSIAERAEAYIKQKQQERAKRSQQGSVNTKSGLENRQSKEQRIQEALKN